MCAALECLHEAHHDRNLAKNLATYLAMLSFIELYLLSGLIPKIVQLLLLVLKNLLCAMIALVSP